jgi:hypothetical protein
VTGSGPHTWHCANGASLVFHIARALSKLAHRTVVVDIPKSVESQKPVEEAVLTLHTAACQSSASVLGQRVCALLAAASAGMHAIMAASHGAMAIQAVAMAAVCLRCAWELWTAPTIRTWVVVATMNIAMVAVHLPPLGAHQHGLTGPIVVQGHSDPFMALTIGFSAVEIVAATTVLERSTKRRAQRLIPGIAL